MSRKPDLLYDREKYFDAHTKKTFLKAIQDESHIEECLQTEHAWPYLYHLSNIRENILDWHNFDPKGSLLEIGAECGALTGLFCRKVNHVTALEPSRLCAAFNGKRNKNYSNLTILSGDFKKMKAEGAFDYVTLIGTLAYAAFFFSGEDPAMDMLKMAGNFLKPGGEMIIAIENRYGLKYFSGAAEDHTERYFDGLENYAHAGAVNTFSRNALAKMLKEAGFSDCAFYYPMPDYKFPTEIYSDRRLPSFGSIRNACVSYEKDRYELFDERLAYDAICKDGMFRDFSNSFLAICGRDPDAAVKRNASVYVSHKEENGVSAENDVAEIVEYVKYNRLREPQFQIKTSIFTGPDNVRYVRKEAMCAQARAHVNRFSEHYHKLAGADGPTPARLLSNENGTAVFPYMDGSNLAEKVGRHLGKGDRFLSEMQKAVHQIFQDAWNNPQNLTAFQFTGEFEKIFGPMQEMQDASVMHDMKSFRISNVDSILSNFVEKPDGRLVCLDYEWVFDFPVPAEYLVYRTVFYYYSENRAYIEPEISEQRYFAQFGLTKDKIRMFSQMEEHFQQYIHGKDHKRDYTKNYEKKTINIGKNMQHQESWFLTIMDAVHCFNSENDVRRRDLVECRIKIRQKNPFLAKCGNVVRNPGKLKKLFRK